MLNDTNTAMLALLKTACLDPSDDMVTAADWEAVYHEMVAHHVAALAGNVLQNAQDLSAGMNTWWTRQIVHSVQRYYYILGEQQQLLELLHAEGIRPVVLKGTAAAQYYPEPAYRGMGDVDLLLPEGTAEQAHALMLKHGYEPLEGEVKCHKHFQMGKNGVVFEMHRCFSTLSDRKKAKLLDSMLFAALETPVRCENEGYCFDALPDLENGLVILEHVNHHMSSGIGLRQIIDWLLYVDRVLDDKFWTSSFQPVVRQLGLETLAMVIAHMGQLYLGLRTENRTWCRDVDETLCQEMLAFILDNGDFGRKHGNEREAAMVMTRFTSIGKAFKSLQELGCVNFKEQIEKYPILRPFAWLMRLVRLGVLAVRRKLTPGDLASSYQESRRRVGLFRRLGVLESEDEDE